MHVDVSSAAAAVMPAALAQCGSTALIRAAICGRADDMQLLLNAGADKEARNKVRCRSLCCLISDSYTNKRRSMDLLRTATERQRKNARFRSLVVSGT